MLQGFAFASRRDIPGSTTITIQVNNGSIVVYGAVNKNDSSVNHIDDMAFTNAAWPTVLPS